MAAHISPILASAPGAGPLALCLLAGFVLGGVGHLYRSAPAIVAGILLIAGTVAVFVATTNPSLGG